MRKTAWQDVEVASQFLDQTRDAVPYRVDQVELLLHLVRHFRPDPRVIVDLGCGDGILARTLLAVYPQARALLLDHSEPMLARAREAMTSFEGRSEILLADLADPLECGTGSGSVDLIVSGYAIHHLPHERKRSLYQEVYRLLAPGGLFVNLEHVASTTPRLEALWDSLMVERISAHTGKSRDQAMRDYLTRPDRADNILELVETQVAWLREIGFEQADCYFKWLELAVFGGIKPASAP